MADDEVLGPQHRRNLRDGHTRLSYPAADICRLDHQPWPCDVVAGLDRTEALEERVAQLEAELRDAHEYVQRSFVEGGNAARLAFTGRGPDGMCVHCRTDQNTYHLDTCPVVRPVLIRGALQGVEAVRQSWMDGLGDPTMVCDQLIGFLRDQERRWPL